MFLSKWRIDVLCDDFIRWYGNAKCLEAEHTYDLSLKDQLALLLYRFRIEGIRVLFCPDPRMGFDVKTAMHIFDLLLSGSKKGLDVCILSCNTKEHIADCDQLILYNDAMPIQPTPLYTFPEWIEK